VKIKVNIKVSIKVLAIILALVAVIAFQFVPYVFEAAIIVNAILYIATMQVVIIPLLLWFFVSVIFYAASIFCLFYVIEAKTIFRKYDII